MFYLYSYSNINDKGDAKTEGTTLFVGNGTQRSAYRDVKSFYANPITSLRHSFEYFSTFNPDRYSTICQLPGLSISTIRAAIANHFPEYLI